MINHISFQGNTVFVSVFYIINYNAMFPNQLLSVLSYKKKLNLKLVGEGVGCAGHGLCLPEYEYVILP